MTSFFFEEHSVEELKEWTRRLKIFRYVRRQGGLADDGDRIICAYSYKDDSELEKFLNFLNNEMVVYSSEPPKAEYGRCYTNEEREAFPSIINDTKWIEQPGNCLINGALAFIWCSNGKITIHASAITTTPDYSVGNDHVRSAELIEQVLVDSPLPVLDPPLNSERCLCPLYHSSFFI
tara:strand:+ start:119 stop:652 length:534 start_codon:yes stop_codon:yes gene_type:complete